MPDGPYRHPLAALRGWPGWLLLAHPDDRAVLTAAWTPAGTITVLTAVAQGGAVDRRGFLIVTGGALSALGTDWANALPASATHPGRRQLTADMVTGLEQRLDSLRRLDDVLGGAGIRHAAVAELQLLDRLANDAHYDDAVGRRLFAAVAEAGRICGWTHFDAGQHAAAQTFYLTALRAAATAGDPATGANILTFMSIQANEHGHPREAASLARTALERSAAHATPRVRSLLHARTGRALALVGERNESARQLGLAADALAAGPHDDDPPWLYYYDEYELRVCAGRAAMDLDRPTAAAQHLLAAASHRITTGYLRDAAKNLAEAAQARLASGNLDATCDTGRRAAELATQVDSNQVIGALAGLRADLAPHRSVPVVRDFLDRTA
ncbi:MAG: transcriptional regulator [Actinobacteria bacterium]|nr:transcriptional regulator [Actinomycetota bacterium]MBI3686008.1 transcriptional regulator [Actinomycetota bacterium]